MSGRGKNDLMETLDFIVLVLFVLFLSFLFTGEPTGWEIIRSALMNSCK